MKFSVLIPVYNTEKYLEECLRSVLNQTYQDFEIIIVDDGSTDKSGAICEKYKDDFPEKIKVIHQENSGQLVSRVNAIRKATGDYCMFLDADDLFVSNTIESIYNCIFKTGFPDMVFFPFWYDRNGTLEKSRLIVENCKLFLNNDIPALRKQFFSDILLNNMWTKVVKREILLSSIYDYESFASLRCAEDRLQSMWILDNIHSAYYINIPLYQYRLFEGSTTRTYSHNNIEKYNTSILYSEEKKYLLKWGFDTNEWADRLQAVFITYIVYVFNLFYMNIKKEERTKVINFDWHSFIPDEIVLGDIEKNSFIPDLKKNILSWILTKNERKIKRYYLRKRLYQKLRKMKRKFRR